LSPRSLDLTSWNFYLWVCERPGIPTLILQSIWEQILQAMANVRES
jgi:hypothetical protein